MPLHRDTARRRRPYERTPLVTVSRPFLRKNSASELVTVPRPFLRNKSASDSVPRPFLGLGVNQVRQAACPLGAAARSETHGAVDSTKELIYSY